MAFVIFDLDIYFNNRYDLITSILNIIQNNSNFEHNIIESADNLRLELKLIGNDISNIDRRIALERELTNNMNNILSVIKSDSQNISDSELSDAIQNYYTNEKQLINAGILYDNAAKVLKTAVEVFPKSFLARLNNIKSVDRFYAKEFEAEL